MNAEAVRAWLAAQIDADARAVEIIPSGGYAPPVWRTRPTRSGRWVEIYPLDRTVDEPPGAEVDEGGIVALVTTGRCEHEHIALHDPARVQREIEAKRRRLERHIAEPWKPLWPGHTCDRYQILGIPDGWTGPLTHWCGWCSETQSREEWFYAPWPCPDIIDDAQSFADRADFPDELRLP